MSRKLENLICCWNNELQLYNYSYCILYYIDNTNPFQTNRSEIFFAKFMY